MANNSAPNVGRLPTFVTASNRSVPTRVLRSLAPPPPRCAQNAEGASQQMPRPADSPGPDQPANLAAGDGFAAQSHLGIYLNLKSHFAPKLGQLIDVARGPVSEAEIESFVHFAGVQLQSTD